MKERAKKGIGQIKAVTADLYQNQDDNMSDMRETGGYVDGG